MKKEERGRTGIDNKKQLNVYARIDYREMFLIEVKGDK